MFELFNAEALHRFPALVVAEHCLAISAHPACVRDCLVCPADEMRQYSQNQVFNSIVPDVIHHHNRLGRCNRNFCGSLCRRGSHQIASAAMPLKDPSRSSINTE